MLSKSNRDQVLPHICTVQKDTFWAQTSRLGPGPGCVRLAYMCVFDPALKAGIQLSSHGALAFVVVWSPFGVDQLF